jgi:hypothetical protein
MKVNLGAYYFRTNAVVSDYWLVDCSNYIRAQWDACTMQRHFVGRLRGGNDLASSACPKVMSPSLLGFCRHLSNR